MRALAILAMVAALSGGCAFEAGESEPTRDGEPTADERSAFDASLFKFSIWVADDRQGDAGGSQRASTVLKFVDARESWLNPDKWECRITISMPIRHRTYGIITPERAAQMSAEATEAASSTVMNSRPKWNAGLFCGPFAVKTLEILNNLNIGARVSSP